MDDGISLRRFHRVILTLGLTTLGTYATAVCVALLLFRTEVSLQILQRDGVLLASVSQHFHDRLDQPVDDTDLLEVAFESSELSGVIGVRLHDAEGSLIGKYPASLYDVALAGDDLQRLAAGEPVTRHYAHLPLEDLFSDQVRLDDAQAPAVNEVIAPVKGADGNLAVAIQFWLDGAEVAVELAQLDRFLVILGSVFICAGGLIFLLVFVYARQRLLGMGRLLADRNRALEQVNAELARAARTSAIGSVTSHLFHGLKNPLAGLKAYLRLTAGDVEAVALTERMQSLIDETLSVIREVDSGTDIDLTLPEFLEMNRSRFEDAAAGRVKFTGSGDGCIPSRKAQLLLLILRNLIENALEASPPGESVQVAFRLDRAGLAVSVSDKGPGLPDAVRDRLFEPVQSSKSNGTGIGLAISAAIARHLAAALELAESGEHGTTFRVQMPV